VRIHLCFIFTSVLWNSTSLIFNRDSSIPPLESCYSSDEDMAAHKLLGKLVDDAFVREQNTAKREKAQPRHPNYECKPPPRKTEIQTSRLFLSSLGLINFDGEEV
jgi:hypothetical protein